MGAYRNCIETVNYSIVFSARMFDFRFFKINKMPSCSTRIWFMMLPLCLCRGE